MTLTAEPPPTMVAGQQAVVRVTVAGPSPVHAVSLDFPADGGPAWYYVLADGRGTLDYVMGPLRNRKGRLELTVRAQDEMGCEASNSVRLFVTVQ